MKYFEYISSIVFQTVGNMQNYHIALFNYQKNMI